MQDRSISPGKLSAALTRMFFTGNQNDTRTVLRALEGTEFEAIADRAVVDAFGEGTLNRWKEPAHV